MRRRLGENLIVGSWFLEPTVNAREQHRLYVVLVNTRIDHILKLIVDVWCARNIKLVVRSEESAHHADWVMGFDYALDITLSSCHLWVNFDNGVDRIEKSGYVV